MITNSQKLASDLLVDLKRKAEIEAELKVINQSISEQEVMLYDRMTDEGIDSISVET